MTGANHKVWCGRTRQATKRYKRIGFTYNILDLCATYSMTQGVSIVKRGSAVSIIISSVCTYCGEIGLIAKGPVSTALLNYFNASNKNTT